MSDSAGTPWAGRHFEHNASSNDAGAASPAFMDAIHRFRRGEGSQSDVVDAIRESRLLVPLVAELGKTGVTDHGLVHDKSAELAIVTVEGPDGRSVLPAFSSVAAMQLWNPKARPVPADAVRVALAAASEGTELVVIDPGSETEFALRRPAVWAIGQGVDWEPAQVDQAVAFAFFESTDDESAVMRINVLPGDPESRLAGPELVIELRLFPGLDQERLDGLLARLQARWSEDEVIMSRVDSIGLRVLAAT